MSTETMSQIQVRIDSKTKKQAKKILENMGFDISGAIKVFLRQIINTRSFPCEIRDENGFTPKKAQELRNAEKEAKNSKTFNSVDELMKDLMS